MLEGRDNNSGWVLVASAIIALVVFTGLLYIRGGSAPKLTLGGGGGTAAATSRPTPSRSPAASGVRASPGSSAAASGRAGASGAVAGATGAAGATASDGASDSESAGPTRTPRPSATARGSAAAAYRLPKSTQRATVALENGQGGCPTFPTGGVVVESTFTQPSATRLTAISPSGQTLTGRVQADGTFTLTADNPQERWVGSLSATGGVGSYFVVSNGCTEGYETTIAFE